jgi:hypothetical protein
MPGHRSSGYCDRRVCLRGQTVNRFADPAGPNAPGMDGPISEPSGRAGVGGRNDPAGASGITLVPADRVVWSTRAFCAVRSASVRTSSTRCPSPTTGSVMVKLSITVSWALSSLRFGTRRGCILGRDCAGIQTSIPPGFPLRFVNLTRRRQNPHSESRTRDYGLRATLLEASATGEAFQQRRDHRGRPASVKCTVAARMGTWLDVMALGHHPSRDR